METIHQPRRALVHSTIHHQRSWQMGSRVMHSCVDVLCLCSSLCPAIQGRRTGSGWSLQFHVAVHPTWKEILFKRANKMEFKFGTRSHLIHFNWLPCDWPSVYNLSFSMRNALHWWDPCASQFLYGKYFLSFHCFLLSSFQQAFGKVWIQIYKVSTDAVLKQ